jgi:wyosine [tRNA(Phe)-imidazoG37] synthetase (radical SAM superfamily)
MAEILGLQKGIIYGPVGSRRLGRSLGINLSPTRHKVCSFNCVYCHYGWTKYLTSDVTDYAADLPAKEEVVEALGKALERLSPPPEYITFSGNGEPTLHPDFDWIVDAVIGVRQRSGTQARLAVLSNSTAAADPAVRAALAKLDVRIMKLDAGSQAVLDLINRPAPGVSIEAIVDGLRRMEDITLQSVFVDGEVSNTGDADVEAWLDRVEEVRPTSIQVYSLENAPALSTLVGVPPDRLRQIAERVRERTGIEVKTY